MITMKERGSLICCKMCAFCTRFPISSLLDCVLNQVGLASDAATFARLVNGSDCAVVAPLVKRLESLDRKWRRGNFSGETKVELE